MKKLTLLVAVVAASAALFVLPAVASAEEIHFDTATTFTGTGAGVTQVATGEPAMTCTATDIVNGVINAGGTTGSMTLDLTGCNIPNPFGGTAPCHTKGAPLNNTIATGGTFHLITIKAGVPGVLLTTNTTETTCETFGFAITTHVTGNLIGTITSPACGALSKEMKLSFSTTGSTQNHLEYTGNLYDLIAKTGAGGTGEPRTAGLNANATLTANTAGTLTCT